MTLKFEKPKFNTARMERKKGNKYHAKISKCHKGHNHRSGLEAGHCNILHAMKEIDGRRIKSIQWEKTVEFYVNNKFIAKHKPDFWIEFWDNSNPMIVESKGVSTQDYIIRRNLLKALYPLCKYEVWRK